MMLQRGPCNLAIGACKAILAISIFISDSKYGLEGDAESVVLSELCVNKRESVI